MIVMIPENLSNNDADRKSLRFEKLDPVPFIFMSFGFHL
jgi:hypothetical protein